MVDHNISNQSMLLATKKWRITTRDTFASIDYPEKNFHPTKPMHDIKLAIYLIERSQILQILEYSFVCISQASQHPDAP